MFQSERGDKEHCGKKLIFFTWFVKSLIFSVVAPDMDRLIRLFWLFRLYKCEIRPIIYGYPEAIVGKLRKLLDCEDVRRNIRAVLIFKEGHLVVEWQVFDICIELFPFTTWFNIGICQVNEFLSAIMLWGQRI